MMAAPAPEAKSVLQRRVEYYNKTHNEVSLDILTNLITKFRQEQNPTKTQVYSILPVTALELNDVHQARITELLQQLLDYFYQGMLSRCAFPEVYLMGFSRILPANSFAISREVLERWLNDLTDNLKRHDTLLPEEVIVLLTILNKWLNTREPDEHIDKKKLHIVITKLTSMLDTLTLHPVDIWNDRNALNIAYKYFLYFHVRSVAKLAVGKTRWKFDGRSLSQELANPTIAIIAIVGVFLWAAASSVAPPLGVAIVGVIASSVLVMEKLESDVPKWFNDVQRNWKQYKIFTPEEKAYREWNDIMTMLPLLERKECPIGEWRGILGQIHSNMPKDEKFEIAIALILTEQMIRYLRQHPETEHLNKAMPYIYFCVDMYATKKQKAPYGVSKRKNEWLMALCKLERFFTTREVIRQAIIDIFPLRKEKFKKPIEKYIKNYTQFYSEKNETLIDYEAKPFETTPEINEIKRQQEIWLQGLGFSTQKIDKIHTSLPDLEPSWEVIKQRGYMIPNLDISYRNQADNKNETVPLDIVRDSLITKAQQNKPDDSVEMQLLIGEPGMGKSVALRWLFEELKQCYNENMFENPIPIRIPLFGAFSLDNETSILDFWLKEQCEYSDKNISTLKSEHCVVILFDSYDEFRFYQHDRSVTKLNYFMQQINAQHWRASVLMTTRDYLVKECEDHFKPETYYSLTRITNEQKHHYLVHNANQTLNTQLKIASLQHSAVWELMGCPLILYYVSEALTDLCDDIVNGRPQSRYTVYDAFVKLFFIREYEQRIRQFPKQLLPITQRFANDTERRMIFLDFAENIARQMFIDKTQTLAYEKVKNLKWYEPDMLKSIQHITLNMPQLGPLNLIIDNDNKEYQFSHQTIFEFLIAKQLKIELEQANNPHCPMKMWQSIILNKQENTAILQFLIESNPKKELMDAIIKKPTGIEHHKYDTTENLPLARIKGNIITLMNACQILLDGIDLSNNYLCHASVAGNTLHGANLQNTIMEKTHAPYSDWSQANAHGAHLDIDTGETASWKLAIRGNIDCVAQHDNYFAVAYGDFVYIYNLMRKKQQISLAINNRAHILFFVKIRDDRPPTLFCVDEELVLYNIVDKTHIDLKTGKKKTRFKIYLSEDNFKFIVHMNYRKDTNNVRQIVNLYQLDRAGNFVGTKSIYDAVINRYGILSDKFAINDRYITQLTKDQSDKILVYDVDTNELVAEVPFEIAHDDLLELLIRDMTIFLFIASSNGLQLITINLSNMQFETKDFHISNYTAIQLSNDGKRLVHGNRYVWDLENMHCQELYYENITKLIMHNNSRQLFFITQDNFLKAFSIENIGHLPERISRSTYNNRITEITFIDSHKFLYGNNTNFKMFNYQKNKPEALRHHSGQILDTNVSKWDETPEYNIEHHNKIVKFILGINNKVLTYDNGASSYECHQLPSFVGKNQIFYAKEEKKYCFIKEKIQLVFIDKEKPLPSEGLICYASGELAWHTFSPERIKIVELIRFHRIFYIQSANQIVAYGLSHILILDITNIHDKEHKLIAFIQIEEIPQVYTHHQVFKATRLEPKDDEMIHFDINNVHSQIAYASDYNIRIISINARPVSILSTRISFSRVTLICFHPNGSKFYAFYSSGHVTVWDTSQYTIIHNRKILPPHTHAAISDDFKYIALGIEDHLWCGETTEAEINSAIIPFWKCTYMHGAPVTNFNGCNITDATMSDSQRVYMLQNGAFGSDESEA